MRKLKNILVTGGAGFIGCNFIHFLLEKADGFEGRIINVDALTYAGNAASLSDIEDKFGSRAMKEKARYIFERGDICDGAFIKNIFEKYKIDTVVHFAAESHVDRSILGPEAFVKTNVIGTFTLLDSALNAWRENDVMRNNVLFHHISTDEVYGSLGETGAFSETTPYDPRSPYSASKASSDHLVMAYHHTYGLPVTLSNCSNNYGPFQFPEKLIPLMIMNMLEGKQLPVYGDGKNIRDWIFVEDHNRAVWQVIQNGKSGEKYNIGGGNEWENIKLLKYLIKIVSEKSGISEKKITDTITYIKDRPGHDRRYAIDCSKIKKELNFKNECSFENGLQQTVDWYMLNKDWIENIRSGEYRSWLERNYSNRI